MKWSCMSHGLTHTCQCYLTVVSCHLQLLMISLSRVSEVNLSRNQAPSPRLPPALLLKKPTHKIKNHHFRSLTRGEGPKQSRGATRGVRHNKGEFPESSVQCGQPSWPRVGALRTRLRDTSVRPARPLRRGRQDECSKRARHFGEARRRRPAQARPAPL